jgi:hypothetical protein
MNDDHMSDYRHDLSALEKTRMWLDNPTLMIRRVRVVWFPHSYYSRDFGFAASFPNRNLEVAIHTDREERIQSHGASIYCISLFC